MPRRTPHPGLKSARRFEEPAANRAGALGAPRRGDRLGPRRCTCPPAHSPRADAAGEAPDLGGLHVVMRRRKLEPTSRPSSSNAADGAVPALRQISGGRARSRARSLIEEMAEDAARWRSPPPLAPLTKRVGAASGIWAFVRKRTLRLQPGAAVLTAADFAHTGNPLPVCLGMIRSMVSGECAHSEPKPGCLSQGDHLCPKTTVSVT